MLAIEAKLTLCAVLRIKNVCAILSGMRPLDRDEPCKTARALKMGATPIPPLKRSMEPGDEQR
jgi:hypothetical protein